MKHSGSKKADHPQLEDNQNYNRFVLARWKPKIMEYIQSTIQNNQQPKILLPAKLSFKSKKK